MLASSKFYAEVDYRDKRANSQYAVRTKLSTVGAASSTKKRISKESLFQKRLSSKALDAYFKSTNRNDLTNALRTSHITRNTSGSTALLGESQLNLGSSSNVDVAKSSSLDFTTENNSINVMAAEQRQRRAPASCKIRFIKRFMKLMFSSIGLVLVVALYAVFGALMFQLLEYHEELRICEEGQGKYYSELKHLRETLKAIGNNLTATEFFNRVDRLKTVSQTADLHQYSLHRSTNFSDYAINVLKRGDNSSSSFSSRSASEQHDPNVLLALGGNVDLLVEVEHRIDDLLREFRNNVLMIEEKYKFYGQNCTTDYKWKFFPAILYSVTVISTVGYGFIAPLTWEGRIVTICYASIGIPIFLMCLTNLSGSMANAFRSIYYKIDAVNPIKNYFRRRKALQKLRRRDKRLASRMANATTSSSIVQQTETTQVPPTSATTVNDEPKKKKKSSLMPNGFSNYYEFAIKPDMESPASESDDEDDDDDNDEENSDYEYADASEVPFFMSLLVILLYVIGGGYMVKSLEGWTLGQSIYFVYVTVSTMVSQLTNTQCSLLFPISKS